MNQDAIPWYKSPVIVSQVVTAVSAFLAVSPKLATTLGLTSTDAINTAVTAVFGIIAVIAPIYGAIKRASSPLQPVTLTQTGADMHPNTIANAQAAVAAQNPPPTATVKTP